MTTFQPDYTYLDKFIEDALWEDVHNGDITALATIPTEKRDRAVLKVKANGVLAGVELATLIFKKVDPSVSITFFKKDGDAMQNGDIAFEVECGTQALLKAERLVLNTMQRMSGIATLTNAYVEKIKNYSTKLLDSRKTTPNFRLLEKEAVKIGGGVNHRFGLYDMIMLKDNHIDYCGGISKAIAMANAYVKTNKPGLKIEIETRSIEDVKEVLQVGNVDVIMLDNFTPEKISEALLLIDGKYKTEASGGINIDNIALYAATGVDFISSGAIIHQAKSLDLSLKAVLIKN